MSDQLTVRNSIMSKTTASKAWNALANPKETKKYMFGGQAVSDWNVGSLLLWKSVHEA